MAGAPAVQHLEHWTLVTSDMERTKRFYREVLGATEAQRISAGPECLVLGTTSIDCFPVRAERHPSPGDGGQHHAYVIKLEDYDPWVEHLKAHGVPHRLATHGLRWMSIYLDDPDGYHFELTVKFGDDESGRAEMAKRGLLA